MTRVVYDFDTDRVIEQLKEGKRLDGRKADEIRKVEIKNKISENADGSAKVAFGETSVVAGVKFGLGQPYPDSPDEGSLAVGAELLPLASPTFETGPPSEDSIELARVVDRGIRESKAMDFKALCISEGELALIGFVDIYALNYDGNLFDASALAAISALLEAKIPKVEDKKIVPHEYSGSLKIARKPILTTFAKIAGHTVLDPSLVEERAMDARLSISSTEDLQLCAFQKGGSGSITVKEVDAMVDIALEKAKELRKLL